MQVKRLVPPDLYTLYESKLLEATLSSMSDVLYCPRRHCGNPVVIDREDSIAHCANANCGYVFCIYCKATYHGKEPCRYRMSKIRKVFKPTSVMRISQLHCCSDSPTLKL